MAEPRLFTVHGPFDVQVNTDGGAKALNGPTKSRFWKGEAEHLADEKGCYVFARRAGKGFTPLYVGQTKASFRGECFNHYNQQQVGDELAKAKGSLVLFLVTYERSKGPLNKRAINDLERHLIETALIKNKDLLNKNLTSNGPTFLIRGVHATKGKPSEAARTFRRAMGYRARA